MCVCVCVFLEEGGGLDPGVDEKDTIKESGLGNLRWMKHAEV
jgi:uncharacterized membrane-anchored protein